MAQAAVGGRLERAGFGGEGRPGPLPRRVLGEGGCSRRGAHRALGAQVAAPESLATTWGKCKLQGRPPSPRAAGLGLAPAPPAPHRSGAASSRPSVAPAPAPTSARPPPPARGEDACPHRRPGLPGRRRPLGPRPPPAPCGEGELSPLPPPSRPPGQRRDR